MQISSSFLPAEMYLFLFTISTSRGLTAGEGRGREHVQNARDEYMVRDVGRGKGKNHG